MKLLIQIANSSKLRLAISSSYFIYYAMIIIYLIANSFRPSNDIQNGDLTVVLVIALLFVIPVFIIDMFGKTRSHWSKRFVTTGYYLTVIATVFCAIGWYFYPDNGRFEPLTVLFGFVSSWAVFIKNRVPSERIEATQQI